MEKPAKAESHRAQSQRRRIDREITFDVEDEIEQLHQLSAGKRLVEFLLFGSLYLSGALLIQNSSALPSQAFLGVILMGIAMNSLGILIHEGLHGLLARNEHLNHLLSFLCGLPILLSATAYQTTHCDHHFDLGRKLDYGTYRQHLQNKRLVWLAYYSQLFLGSIIYVLFIPVLAFRSASGKARIMIVVEYLVILVTLALLIAWAPTHTLLHYWVGPLIVLMALSNLRGLASHALGDVDDIYLSSRTVESNLFMSSLFLNENYHLVHHLFPQIPSYNLRKAHTLVWRRLPRALYSRSYASFLADFLRSSLKLDLEPRGLVYPSQQENAD